MIRYRSVEDKELADLALAEKSECLEKLTDLENKITKQLTPK